MPDYKAMYFQLAAKVADAVDTLVDAQRTLENTYIESKDEPIFKVVPNQAASNKAESYPGEPELPQ